MLASQDGGAPQGATPPRVQSRRTACRSESHGRAPPRSARTSGQARGAQAGHTWGGVKGKLVKEGWVSRTRTSQDRAMSSHCRGHAGRGTGNLGQVRGLVSITMGIVKGRRMLR